ncbi:COG1361 family protein [Haloarcula halophila]|uniref:hypothetical protein n=1 Tax=Haloarcula TaxID=2237 RepID=UPI0023E449FB|nr:hypothetical protein [Halomicroarcula sp. DFY41]
MTVLVALSMVAVSGPVAAAPQVGIDAPTDAGTVAPGETFTVTYELTNTGSDDATAGRLDLTTPTGINVTSVSGDGISTPNSDPPAVFYGLNGRITPGETKTTTVTFSVTSAAPGGDVQIGADGFFKGTATNASASTATVVTVDKPSPFELSAAPETVNTQAGGQFNVTYQFTNNRAVPASSGGIEFNVSTNIVPQTSYGDGIKALDRSDPVVFYGVSGPIAGGSTLTTTVSYVVRENTTAETGQIVATGSIQGVDGSDRAVTAVNIEQSVIDRYDTNGVPGIQFREVLAAIEDYNTSGEIGFSDVLTVIAEFNS